jgi:hypothetical protein
MYLLINKNFILGYKGENCDRRSGSLIPKHMLKYIIIGLVSLVLIASLAFGIIQMKRKGRLVKMNKKIDYFKNFLDYNQFQIYNYQEIFKQQ